MVKSFGTAAAIVIALAVGIPGLAQAQAVKGDAGRGATVFKRCMTCHALDPAKKMMGPTLQGVIGRKVGTVAGFKYSKDYPASKLVWDAALIDKYLQNTKAVFPSSRMAFRLPAPQDRADVIAYLSTNPKPKP